MNKYEVIIFWCNHDGCFIAHVPELAGCMAHGATQQEAPMQAQQAMDLWIETALADGVPVPEPKGHRMVSA